MKVTIALETAGAWGLLKRLMLVVVVLCTAGVPAAGAAAAESDYVIALFPSASNPHWEGFARIINDSEEPGTVRIVGIDDAGREYGPIELSLGARATAHFDSEALEAGSPEKGLSGGLGGGEGAWWLRLSSEFDIKPLAYIRTSDGFVTAMHQVVLAEGLRHQVRFFNPGSNRSQRSRLRLVNPGSGSVAVTIEGRDDAGEPAPGGAVRLTLGPREARTLGAQALESSGEDLTGSLGDGTGKWQLFVSATGALYVQSLLASPTGHLSNTSDSGVEPERPKPPEEIRNVGTVLDEWLSREDKSTYEAAEGHCEHIIPSHPSYAQCLKNQLNAGHIHMLNVTVADEHMLCILDAFWNERERDEQIMERLRRFSFAVENSFSNDYRGANSWQGAEGLIDCRELRPDFSGAGVEPERPKPPEEIRNVGTVLDEWLSREDKSTYEAAEGHCEHIIPSHPSYAQCLRNQLNAGHIYMLNVTVADEHMLCILDAFWNERERDEQIMERLRRFSFAVENSFSNDYRGANSWQGAEGLIDCRELRPDFSGG